jgi:hypothetical protein
MLSCQSGGIRRRAIATDKGLESPLGHFTGSAPLPCCFVVLKDWVAIGMSNRAGRIATMYSLRKRGSSHTHSTLT